jgi:putative endonuclease
MLPNRRRKKTAKQLADRAGRRAETVAVWLLRAKAYRIVARNYKRRMGEVDIIARRGRVLVFVEVKYRRNQGLAKAVIADRQWARIARAAEDFTARHHGFERHVWRFDVVVCAPYQWPRHIADCWRMR